MCTVRLGRTFDAVLVHDAVMYLTTEDDLRQAIATTYVHVRPGGVAVFAPDYVSETFRPTPSTAATTATAERCATWSGSPIRTRPTRRSWSTSPTCSARAAAHPAASWSAT